VRSLFWILALFALAVGISLVTRYNEGYVLFFYPPYRVELNLSLFVLLLVVAFVALLGLAKLAVSLIGFPDRVRRYRESRRADGTAQALERAVLAYVEGDVATSRTALQEAKSKGAAGEMVDKLEAALDRIPFER
jgi:HemY protein